MKLISQLRRFKNAPRSDKLLLLDALFMVGRVRAGLVVHGYSKVRNFKLRRASGEGLFSETKIARAVSIASRFVPGATCLTQAVSAQRLLAVHGHASHIRIGVKPAGKGFEAHAWLIARDRIILGGDEESVAAYSVLTDLQDNHFEWR